MAQTIGINKAQTIRLCELCQEGSIKWRCIDCVQCLCEKCKTIHARVAVTAKHQIVTIATPLQDIPKKIIMDNIPCKDHATRMACMFCQTCDSLVCTECVSATHSKHQFVPLEKSIERKLNQLSSVQANGIDNLEFCDSKNNEIQNIKSKYQSIFEDSIEKIQHKEKELKDAIGDYSKRLQKRVNQERTKAEDAVSKVKQHIDQTRQALEKRKDEIENALKSTQGAEIFEVVPSIQTPKISFDSLPKGVEHFFTKTEQATQVQDLFGSLQKIKADFVRENMDLKVFSTFTTDLSYINQLIAETEISAWIGNKEVIRKLYIVDDYITKWQEVSFHISDMALTTNNDILFSDYQSSNVKLLTLSGEIKPFLSVKPLLPRGIHVTRDNEVIVGVRENCKGNPYKVTKESQRAVMVFDINGKQKHSFQYDNKGHTLFTVPLRITANFNQNMFVIDITSDFTGRLVCLDGEGRLKYIYEGHTKINAIKEFDPRDLAITSAGHIIVSDLSSHALHVLSVTGETLFCKVTEGLGILYPWTIDIDGKGQLWVGCSTDGKQTGAKIHIVKLLL